MGPLNKNQKGVITIQFLIVLIIILFFIMSFLGLSLTLVKGSIVQYLTYSSARSLSLGNESLAAQTDYAKLKYASLREKLFSNKYQSSGEWFFVPAVPEIGFNENYTDRSLRKMFYGAFVSFISTRTNFKIPFLTDQEDGELHTTIGSYLGREVSEQECEAFNNQRMRHICAIYAPRIGGGACGNLQPTPSDNGC